MSFMVCASAKSIVAFKTNCIFDYHPMESTPLLIVLDALQMAKIVLFNRRVAAKHIWRPQQPQMTVMVLLYTDLDSNSQLQLKGQASSHLSTKQACCFLLNLPLGMYHTKAERVNKTEMMQHHHTDFPGEGRSDTGENLLSLGSNTHCKTRKFTYHINSMFMLFILLLCVFLHIFYVMLSVDLRKSSCYLTGS